MTTVLVSPHLDDGILSCGATIAHREDTVVVTVFAGIPPAWSWPTPFDSASGFADSGEAVLARRHEDRQACKAIAVRAKHLPFLDGQYGLPPDPTEIIAALEQTFRRAECAWVPLGLAHPDHRLVAKCCRQALRAYPGRRFTVYADLPSAKLYPSHVPGAIRGWERAGYPLTAIEPDEPPRLLVKRTAVTRYVSQTRFPELAWENLREERAWTSDVSTGAADQSSPQTG